MDFGQAMPRERAERRSHFTAPFSGSGRVRSTPTPASSISRAAAMPVSNEISAFQASTSVRGRSTNCQPPSASASTSWSGSCSSTAPRATACSRRSRPNVGSSAIDG
jgi:hypothetical protein